MSGRLSRATEAFGGGIPREPSADFCRRCGVPFLRTHGNQAYCIEHKALPLARPRKLTRLEIHAAKMREAAKHVRAVRLQETIREFWATATIEQRIAHSRAVSRAMLKAKAAGT